MILAIVKFVFVCSGIVGSAFLLTRLSQEGGLVGYLLPVEFAFCLVTIFFGALSIEKLQRRNRLFVAKETAFVELGTECATATKASSSKATFSETRSSRMMSSMQVLSTRSGRMPEMCIGVSR
jgi:hypothetical protein